MDIKVKRTERGWAGHFCCAQRCLFHMNTLLEYKGKKVVVSTVGRLMREKVGRLYPKILGEDGRFITLGPGRYFETFAFMAKENDEYNDADVSKQVLFSSNWQLDNPDAEIEADEMHEAVVKEISERLVNNNLEILEL